MVPDRCISSIRHMYTTDFVYDGPTFLVPLSPSYPSSPVQPNKSGSFGCYGYECVNAIINFVSRARELGGGGGGGGDPQLDLSLLCVYHRNRLFVKVVKIYCIDTRRKLLYRNLCMYIGMNTKASCVVIVDLH